MSACNMSHTIRYTELRILFTDYTTTTVLRPDVNSYVVKYNIDPVYSNILEFIEDNRYICSSECDLNIILIIRNKTKLRSYEDIRSIADGSLVALGGV